MSPAVGETPAEQRIYVFHHIPKCGGTSMKRVFRKWFKYYRDYRPAWARGKKLERFKNKPIRLDKLKPGSILCGHYEVDGIHLLQRYPELEGDPRFFLITFVREPLALRLSLIRHESMHKRLRGDESIDELLLGRPNWICNRFPCRSDNMDATLDRYSFIGCLEDDQQAMDALAATVHRRPTALPHKNRSKPLKLEVSEALKTEFRRVHALDYELYRRCLARRTYA